MPYYCTVPRCTSMAGKAKNVSFHQFPRDEQLARLWNDVLKRGKPYTKYSKVCSLHFKPEDYTITSVGKNKGQWRTLRKDAVPSQNLPSETPAPYTRKQWDWNRNTASPNVLDPTIQQQMAQAIYMQTMLAMQAATPGDAVRNGPPIIPDVPVPQTSTETDTLKGKHTDEHTSYKCTECTKCFKDPDVFLLHKRSHTKDKSVEKENFNMNVTLRSNPILANLLKTNNEASFDPNWVTMESLLMTALAANMDYLRNFSMIKDDCDRSDVNNSRGDLNNSRGDLNNSDLNNSRDDLNDSRGDLSNARGDTNPVDNFSRVTGDLRNPNVLDHDDNHSITKDESSGDSPKPDDDLSRDGLSPKGLNNGTSNANTSKEINSFNDEGREITYSGKYYRERCLSTDCEKDGGCIDNYNRVIDCDNDLNESLDSNGLVIDESV